MELGAWWLGSAWGDSHKPVDIRSADFPCKVKGLGCPLNCSAASGTADWIVTPQLVWPCHLAKTHLCRGESFLFV